jgi:hypothetical protein
MEGCCEQDHENLSSIKFGEFSDGLSDCKAFKDRLCTTNKAGWLVTCLLLSLHAKLLSIGSENL